MKSESNQTRLETAFYVAEVELGVTRLIDPEDVDVPNPDEKSIMTYVAQFLHRYPEGLEGKVMQALRPFFRAHCPFLCMPSSAAQPSPRTPLP